MAGKRDDAPKNLCDELWGQSGTNHPEGKEMSPCIKKTENGILFACGCEMWRDGQLFYIKYGSKSCKWSKLCKWRKYMIEDSQKSGHKNVVQSI
jgi:hypothetical protein